MNERDKELAKQADNEFTGEISDDLNHCLVGTEAIQKYADLIRADEREACAKVCEQPIDEIQITDDCSEMRYMDGKECAEAIRAKENT